MQVLSFTGYVEADVDTVQQRLAGATEAAPTDTTIEVTSVDNALSRVIVRVPWEHDTEATRKAGTIEATRFASKVLDGAIAA